MALKLIVNYVPDVVSENINNKTRAGQLSNVPDQNAFLCKSLLKVLDNIPLKLRLQPCNRLCQLCDLPDVLERPEILDQLQNSLLGYCSK